MAGLFSDGARERIRAANDIVDVIGSYIPLKRAGATFRALCPFHKERTPSFHVNPQRQIFKCFGCQKGGDVFTFVMAYENVEFPEAVKRLADRAKIPLEYEQGDGAGQARHLKESLLQIHEQITQRWQNALGSEASGQIARDYLVKRGVTPEAVKLFRLGYAPDLWDDTVNWAKSKGHELTLVEKAGLILRKEGSDSYYDRFRGRLMFAICDEQGKVIGFSGRILSGDEKSAKYVNSPETPIFTKSKVIFGLDKSKRALLDAESAIVCEGQLDLIACFMAGVQNVVAPQGTAFTAEQARILKRYVSEVVLCFDSDQAGQNATVRSLDHLLAVELAVRVATVPSPHDPDSFIKASGGDAFRQLIERAEGFFDYYLHRLCGENELSSDKGRLAVLREMAEAVHKTRNGVLIDKYAQKTALRLGVSADAVRAEFRKLSRTRPVASEPTSSAEEVPVQVAKPPTHEYWLLKLLLGHDELLAWATVHVDPQWLQHPVAKEIVSRRLDAHKNQTWQTVVAFLDECDSPELKNLITEVTITERPLPNPAQQLADVALELRKEFMERQNADLIQKLGQPELSEAERLELLMRQQELRVLKRQAFSVGAGDAS